MGTITKELTRSEMDFLAEYTICEKIEEPATLTINGTVLLNCSLLVKQVYLGANSEKLLGNDLSDEELIEWLQKHKQPRLHMIVTTRDDEAKALADIDAINTHAVEINCQDIPVKGDFHVLVKCHDDSSTGKPALCEFDIFRI